MVKAKEGQRHSHRSRYGQLSILSCANAVAQKMASRCLFADYRLQLRSEMKTAVTLVGPASGEPWSAWKV